MRHGYDKQRYGQRFHCRRAAFSVDKIFLIMLPSPIDLPRFFIFDFFASRYATPSAFFSRPFRPSIFFHPF